MFTFRRGANNPKKAPASQASADSEGGDEGDKSHGGKSRTPVEPPTPSPFRSDPNALPLIVENAPTPVVTGKEGAKKAELLTQRSESTASNGGGATGQLVTAGKSSRAPTLRLKEGSRVRVEGLKAKALADIGTKFFTFGAKKEPDLFVRFSVGSLIPPCRTKASTKANKTCDWGDDSVEFIVTDDVAKLMGSDLQLTVQLYTEGQKGSDTLVGSAMVDMSNFLNQGPFSVTIAEGKKAKGELDMVLAYLLPGLLTTEAPADTDPKPAASKPVVSKTPPPEMISLSSVKPPPQLDDPSSLGGGGIPSPRPSPHANEPSRPTTPDTPASNASNNSTSSSPGGVRKSVTIALPHEHDPNLARRPSSEALADRDKDKDKEGGGRASPKGPDGAPRRVSIDSRPPSPMAPPPQDDKARRASSDASVLSPRQQLLSGAGHNPPTSADRSPTGSPRRPPPLSAPTSPKPEDPGLVPTVDPGVEGLTVTADLAQHVLIKVKEDAASTLQQPPEAGAVRRMVDTIKDGVAKAMQKTPTTFEQQKPAVGPPTSARRPSLKLDLSPTAQAAAAPQPLQSPAPFVSQPVAGSGITPREEVTPRPSLTPRLDIPRTGTQQEERPPDKKEDEEEDGVEKEEEGDKGITLAQVLESMAQDGDDDEEAFFLGARPQAPAFIRAQGARPGKPPLGQDDAVTALQAAWRRKAVAKQMRHEQLHARRIQALFRGHRDRKDFRTRILFLTKLEKEESVRHERQMRLMKNHRELQLLRLTPALELGQMDVRRREFAARRIQHFTRKHSRLRLQKKPLAKKTPLGLASPRHRPNIPPLIDSAADEEAAVEEFVGTYKRSLLEPRSPAGRRREEGPTSPAAASPSGRKRPLPVQRRPTAIRLADLHRKVVSNTRAKDRRDVLQRFEASLAMGVRAFNAAANPQSGAQVRYQKLLESRYEARLLLEARHQNQEERTDVSGSRQERLQRVRKLLDQLETPPTLSGLREAFGLDDPSDGSAPKQDIKAVPDIALPWRLPRGGKAAKLAEEAHRHALDTLNGKSNRWWATSLPEDLAEPPVDIRLVKESGPPPFCENLDPNAHAALAPGIGGFTEDEASMWWYAYARKDTASRPHKPTEQNPADGTGPGVGDLLLQRARLGRGAMREAALEETSLRAEQEEKTANELVSLVLKERRKRLSAAAVRREAEARREEARRQEDLAAQRIQAAYRGSAVRKQVVKRR